MGEVIDDTPRCKKCGGSIHPCYQYTGDERCEDCWVEGVGKKVKGGLRLRYYGGKPKHHGQGKRNDLTESEAA